MVRGGDSGSKVSVAQISALAEDGYKFWLRYLTRADDWRTVSLAEIQAFHKARMSVGFYFQHKSDQPAYFNRANALEDAECAIKRSQSLQLPAGTNINFACDTDVTPATLDQVAEYFRIVSRKMAETPWICCGYGDADILDYCFAHDLISGGVATNAKAWSRKPNASPIIQQGPQITHRSGLRMDTLEIEIVDNLNISEEDAQRAAGLWVWF